MLARSGKRRVVALLLAGVAGISAAQSLTPVRGAGSPGPAGAGRDLQQPAERVLAQHGYVWNRSRP